MAHVKTNTCQADIPLKYFLFQLFNLLFADKAPFFLLV